MIADEEEEEEGDVLMDLEQNLVRSPRRYSDMGKPCFELLFLMFFSRDQRGRIRVPGPPPFE